MLAGICATMLIAAAPAATPQAQIEAALAESAAGWNTGDLDRFLGVYADDAIFVSGGKMARGRAEIAASYAASFAAGAAPRGQLTLQPVAFRALSAVHMLFVGRWTLTPAGGGPAEGGLTTLLFERRKGGWRIISDHSSP